jgi:hypothetical protein
MTEQDVGLLETVYSVQKFSIYIFDHKIYLNSDNKAISFINFCALTSKKDCTVCYVDPRI